MTDRTAIDTIRGFFYQFDYTIASLLELVNEEDIIVIEGVEDIDIKNAKEETAIQCKYYAKTEYNHSVIAEPIRLMLNHFKDVRSGLKTKLKYKLRGYYKSGQGKLTLPIDVQFLKDNFLTFTRTEKVGTSNTKVKHFHHEDISLDDSALAEFITLLDININAKEFEIQYSDILSELKAKFNCSNFMAECFYYNNALGLIRSLSKEPKYEDRRISKKEFLEKINTGKILFNEWFIKIKGEKSYFENLRKEYFGNLNILFKERFFLIEINPSKYLRTEIKDIIDVLIKKYTKIINQPTPFCPYIYLHGISRSELIELKKDIIEDGNLISDGFDFEGSSFNPTSIMRKPSIHHQLKIKFLNEIDSLNQTLALTGRKSEIYQFYQTESFFNLNSPSVKEIKIQIYEHKNIKNII